MPKGKFIRRAPANGAGIITPGRPGCAHRETVASDSITGHLIGRCQLCPLVKDYTILQAGIIVSGREQWLYPDAEGRQQHQEARNAIAID